MPPCILVGSRAAAARATAAAVRSTEVHGWVAQAVIGTAAPRRSLSVPYMWLASARSPRRCHGRGRRFRAAADLLLCSAPRAALAARVALGCGRCSMRRPLRCLVVAALLTVGWLRPAAPCGGASCRPALPLSWWWFAAAAPRGGCSVTPPWRRVGSRGCAPPLHAAARSAAPLCCLRRLGGASSPGRGTRRRRRASCWRGPAAPAFRTPLQGRRGRIVIRPSSGTVPCVAHR